MKHTPAPWKLSSTEKGDGYASVIIGGQYNGIIARTELSIYNDIDITEANAKHIVKCVNCHDELLEALENFGFIMPSKDANCHNGICSQDECAHCQRIKKALSAIAKVKGKV